MESRGTANTRDEKTGTVARTNECPGTANTKEVQAGVVAGSVETSGTASTGVEVVVVYADPMKPLELLTQEL